MLTKICDILVSISRGVMCVGVAVMIVSVALQVLSRNTGALQMIWTSDLAKLLFVWLTFLGAAVGLRMGVHYQVDLIPENSKWLNMAVNLISVLAGFAVAGLLVYYGWQLARIRGTAPVQSLGLSWFWVYLAMPVSGAMMLVFLVEMLVTGKPVRTEPAEVSQ